MADQYVYSFSRTITDNKYDIPNPDRVDEGGAQVTIESELQAAIPGKALQYSRRDAATCWFHWDAELDAGEQTTQAQVVADHKANT